MSLPLHRRIGIDDLAHRVDELDDQLRHAIAGRSFAAEQEGARHHLLIRVALDALIQREDVQNLQVLALVFVQALHQHVEHGIGIDVDAEPVSDVVGEPHLVLQLDGPPFAAQAGDRRQSVRGGEVFPGRAPSRDQGAR